MAGGLAGRGGFAGLRFRSNGALRIGAVSGKLCRSGIRTGCLVTLMQRFDRITRNPGLMNGQPCIRGMRLTVRRVVECVALYPDPQDLYRNYPELERGA